MTDNRTEMDELIAMQRQLIAQQAKLIEQQVKMLARYDASDAVEFTFPSVPDSVFSHIKVVK